MGTYEFEFRGGSAKPSEHVNEKFMLFFVVGGEEIPFYRMRSDGLVMRMAESAPRYATGNSVVKLFISQQGFGIPKRWTSFYLRLVDGAKPEVSVDPFYMNDQPSRSGFYFRAKAEFLRKSQILGLLREGSSSYRYAENSKLLPVEVLRQMITIDRSVLREGVRHVRMGG